VIQQRIGCDVTVAQWIVKAYALMLRALVLAGGAADRYGRASAFRQPCLSRPCRIPIYPVVVGQNLAPRRGQSNLWTTMRRSVAHDPSLA